MNKGTLFIKNDRTRSYITFGATEMSILNTHFISKTLFHFGRRGMKVNRFDDKSYMKKCMWSRRETREKVRESLKQLKCQGVKKEASFHLWPILFRNQLIQIIKFPKYGNCPHLRISPFKWAPLTTSSKPRNKT